MDGSSTAVQPSQYTQLQLLQSLFISKQQFYFNKMYALHRFLTKDPFISACCCCHITEKSFEIMCTAVVLYKLSQTWQKERGIPFEEEFIVHAHVSAIYRYWFVLDAFKHWGSVICLEAFKTNFESLLHHITTLLLWCVVIPECFRPSIFSPFTEMETWGGVMVCRLLSQWKHHFVTVLIREKTSEQQWFQHER